MHIFTTAATTLGVLALLSGTALGQGPDPSEVQIRSIVYAGSGCPAGTVVQNLASDGKAFTLLFDSFVAEAGPGIAPSLGRKNCQLAVDLQVPSGWSYSILDVDYRGFAALDAGASGQQSSKYYFEGQAATATLRTAFTGPTSQDYQVRDSLGAAAQVWSPCGRSRALNINSAVSVRATGQRRALLTLDSIDGEVKMIYRLQWRRCGDTPPPAPLCGRLQPGQALYQGQSITSCDGLYTLVLQGDGNLVQYGPSGPIWSTLTGPVNPSSPRAGYGGLGHVAIMQNDGNFVLYNGNTPTWHSNTWGFDGAHLQLQGDSNLVVVLG